MRNIVCALALCVAAAGPASATLVSVTNCTNGVTCTITNDPVTLLGGIVAQDPNDDTLLAWNEVQNYTLTQKLRVDRVFDTTAAFIEPAPGGGYFILPGTVVSSHYLQYDGPRFSGRVTLDSTVFAFMTRDQNLFDSDATLGLPGLDYNDFANRGLEANDTTVFDGNSVNINWATTSPGDWTRLITAFSPTAATVVPVPASLPLLAGGIGLIGLLARRRAGSSAQA